MLHCISATWLTSTMVALVPNQGLSGWS